MSSNITKQVSKIEQLLAKYEIGETLGTGAFSEVKVGIERATGNKFAIKIIDKAKCRGKEGMIDTEVNILKKVRHENIIQLYEMYEIENKIYLVMELVTGGELFDDIVNRVKYSEQDAAKIIRSILLAIDYLHTLGIAHRDLKPENLLLSDKSKTPKIMISDFGLSKIFNDDEVMRTACGTPGYVAPEVLRRQGYGREELLSHVVALADMKIIANLHLLGSAPLLAPSHHSLCGYPPFYDQNNVQLFRQIMAGTYEFDRPWWDNISECAKDFIRHLLLVDTNRRYNARQALQHPYIVSNCGPTVFADEEPARASSSGPSNLEAASTQMENMHIQPQPQTPKKEPVNLAPGITSNMSKTGIKVSHEVQPPQAQPNTGAKQTDAPGRPIGDRSNMDDSACVTSNTSIATKTKEERISDSSRPSNTSESALHRVLRPGPCSIRLLTYNILLRPPGFKNNSSDYKNQRLGVFGEGIIHKYDIVTLQELYSYGSTRQGKMKQLAKQHGFDYCVCSPTKGLINVTIDGGLMILSKYPIVKYERMTFKKGPTGDRFGERGALYAKIAVTTSIHVHIFTTHLQSDSASLAPSDPRREERLYQLLMLKEFIDDCIRNKPQIEPVYLMGTLNVNGRQSRTNGCSSEEYKLMMKIMKGDPSVDLPIAVPKPSIQPIRLNCCDIKYEANDREHPVTLGDVIDTTTMVPRETTLTAGEHLRSCTSVDYILWMNTPSGNNPEAKNGPKVYVDLAATKVEKMLVDGHEFSQLSDHYGVSTVVRIP
ncbi:kinase-like domain-containing protein [Polychytrium aggregatum]|uniref:kinase-like domain-containing protein n=1 Tax=Polychytrium aggregatum TaxID=110093 RepID=UPI0022FF1DDD|nr:kinase-like domain-containing protein [Polychytrium aggregatum]KAI9208875.1 kinase-like domain-containing protein [Polychytrium aggregatum]